MLLPRDMSDVERMCRIEISSESDNWYVTMWYNNMFDELGCNMCTHEISH